VRDAACPFCTPAADRIFHAGRLTLGLWDAFPVSPGHALLLPKRHVASWFEATREEQTELLAALDLARREIEKDHRPDGINIGINIGPAAGQTVPHLHVHLIPRYAGDVPDPRGGVRYVIPSKANYLGARIDHGTVLADRDVTPPIAPELGEELPHSRALITGGEDPLLPHVRSHLDRAASADLAVAFLLESGIALLGEHFRELLERGGRLRIVTGSYLGVTEPNALLELLDLQQVYPDRLELRIFEADDQSFHPKAYLFYEHSGGGVALVGSSNLTRPALTTGVEWNFRVITSRNRPGFNAVREAFEALLRHPRIRVLDEGWVDAYRESRVPEPARVGVAVEPPAPPPGPHAIQQRALQALEATRAAGNTAGLVVLATGLGKTWLSAFDSHRDEYRRVLFVAHREEILRQAMMTYRRIRPEAHLGLYTGQEKAPDADVIFASIQTLGRRAHLERFSPTGFDYIVVDEFHHAAAKTYRRLIDYFEPKFLLGLTATPERTDGGDLLALCQENLVFRCDLAEGIREGLLAPFHYFGVPDEVNYANIPWRSNRFDDVALTQAVATRSRAQNALEQYRARGRTRTLAFCCSTRHADFMRDYFREAGVRAAAVHSDPRSDPRAASLERLEAGELDVVFAVDMFNEGVDLPNVDTVMMLRPTESRILWLQQFGRGLRKAEGKERLNVIDYIGNHRTFLLKPQTLFDLPAGDARIADQLTLLERGEVDLPPGCEVTYELEAMDILRSLLRLPKDEEAVRFCYEDFRERYGARPAATEMHHEGYRPRSVRKAYGSWFGFVQTMGDLTPQQQNLVRQGRAGEFLSVLETTPMTRSYKMLVLLAMLHADRVPGQVTLRELREGVRRLARRSAALQRDLGVSLDDYAALDRMLRQDPIAAWTGGKGTGGVAYFEFENDVLRSSFDVDPNERATFTELVQEIADWRLAEYLDRPGGAEGSPEPEDSFVSRVSHAGGRPILFLPPRDRYPDVPSGWTAVRAESEDFEANLAAVAVNVMRRPGQKENVLPDILRKWFGKDAGLPGTNHQVRFRRLGEKLSLEPLSRVETGAGLEVGRSYMRAEIPRAFGLDFKSTVWQQGFVFEGGHIFLLVTLDKSGMPQEHRYGDRFLSPDLFEWKSQNRHTQESSAGQAIRNHEGRGLPVHLLVRKSGRIGGKGAPFIYCGDVAFVDWEGEKPITVRWRLRTPLTPRLAELLSEASNSGGPGATGR
jgi:superfamily II DNA or RNA helicase/diadenosine tetraphosphate (Ap4A) HIT family hydrolase